MGRRMIISRSYEPRDENRRHVRQDTFTAKAQFSGIKNQFKRDAERASRRGCRQASQRSAGVHRRRFRRRQSDRRACTSTPAGPVAHQLTQRQPYEKVLYAIRAEQMRTRNAAAYGGGRRHGGNAYALQMFDACTPLLNISRQVRACTNVPPTGGERTYGYVQRMMSKYRQRNAVACRLPVVTTTISAANPSWSSPYSEYAARREEQAW